MAMRAFFWVIGFGLAVSGGISIIAYLNVLAVGGNYGGYLEYIIQRPDCYLFPIGILIITLSIFWPSTLKE